MSEYELLLNELSNLCGIIPEYCDTFGFCHGAPPETKKAILSAMGLRTETVDSLAMEISKKQLQQWNTFLRTACRHYAAYPGQTG